MRRIDASARLAQLAFDWDRRVWDGIVRANHARTKAATPAELGAVVEWLNAHEPHMLREALNEVGLP